MSQLEPVQILLVEDSEADAELTRRALDKKRSRRSRHLGQGR